MLSKHVSYILESNVFLKMDKNEHDVRLQHNADYYACSKLQTQQHDDAVAALFGQIQD